jgi:hypothetical protein
MAPLSLPQRNAPGDLLAPEAGAVSAKVNPQRNSTGMDRIGPQFHDLSKRAKDLGSAAVFISLLLCAGVWLTALWQWLN